MYRNVRVEVDTTVISDNIQKIVATYNDYQYYIGVVKGNAYGHGMGIVKTLIANGINYIAVADLDEALEVRAIDADIPILCLAPISLEYLVLCVENRITMTISNYEYYKELLERWLVFSQDFRDSGLKVHVKLNTGFNRLGIRERAYLEEIFSNLTAHPDIELEGIFTHLATSGVLDTVYDTQIRQFKELTQNIDLSQVKIIHLARSSTLEFHNRIEFANGLRVGLLMFGITQTFRDYHGIKGLLRKRKDLRTKKKHDISETKISNDLKLGIAFALKVGILEINKIKQGELVGYGDMFKAPCDGYVAVCPIGYSDGLSLKYLGCNVCINGALYPVVGTINMCLITIFVDENVSLEDEVVIVGGTVGGENNIKETARALEVTPYVVMVSISKSIPRVYV